MDCKCGICIDYPKVKECYKAFTDKNEAEEYASALNDVMKLIGMNALPNAGVYKQEVNSILIRKISGNEIQNIKYWLR